MFNEFHNGGNNAQVLEAGLAGYLNSRVPCIFKFF